MNLARKLFLVSKSAVERALQVRVIIPAITYHHQFSFYHPVTAANRYLHKKGV